jgi:hypothetical protein
MKGWIADIQELREFVIVKEHARFVDQLTDGFIGIHLQHLAQS